MHSRNIVYVGIGNALKRDIFMSDNNEREATRNLTQDVCGNKFIKFIQKSEKNLQYLSSKMRKSFTNLYLTSQPWQ